MNIGIIIPVFEQAKYLARCLHSVITQCGGEDEIVVVDDNDADSADSEAIRLTVNQFVNHPNFSGIIKLTKMGRNQGVSAARNFGVSSLETGIEWLKFLDADDVLAPFALGSFRRETDIPADIAVVGGSLIQVIDGNVGALLKPNFERILFSNPTLVSNSFIRRAAFAKLGGFDTRLQFEEDWDFWLKTEQEFGIKAFGVMDFPVCYYWISGEERKTKKRDHTITVMDAAKAAQTAEGEPFPTKRIDVREYFRQKYHTKS